MTTDSLERKQEGHFKRINGEVSEDELEALREEWREEEHELEEVRKEQDEEYASYHKEKGSIGEEDYEK